MFHKLNVLIFENQISKHEMAQQLHIGYNSLIAKINGRQPFKLDEAFKIQSLYFPNKKIEEIFEINNKSA